jgi:hypothetical protein
MKAAYADPPYIGQAKRHYVVTKAWTQWKEAIQASGT